VPDNMTIGLHLRKMRVLEVLEDVVVRLVVVVQDIRTMLRCRHCGFLTARVHDRRRVRVHDLAHDGRPTVLVWVRRRFVCGNCVPRGGRPPARDGAVRRSITAIAVTGSSMTRITRSRRPTAWWRVWGQGATRSSAPEAMPRVGLYGETTNRAQHRWDNVRRHARHPSGLGRESVSGRVALISRGSSTRSPCRSTYVTALRPVPPSPSRVA